MGGHPRSVPSIPPDDEVMGWSADGAALMVISPLQIPAPVERIEVVSGRVRQFTPPDPFGAIGIQNSVVSADGRSYAYSVFVASSTLFRVEGAK